MAVTFTQPIVGEVLDFASSVRFTGTAPPSVASVSLVAVDVSPEVPFVSAPVTGGLWAATRKFSAPGTRHIEARGFDANENAVKGAVTPLTFTLHQSQLSGYQPPLAVLPHLDKIAHLLEVADRVSNGFIDSKAVFRLPGGQLVIDSNLDLDSDGSSFSAQDATGQSGTSLRMPGGKPVDANAVPFFVLPLAFAHAHGMNLGDFAAVLYKDKVAFALFADVGPTNKIGEGSIALHRALGHEAIKNGHLIDTDIPRDVITITFPGSGNGHFQDNVTVAQAGKALFEALGGAV